MMKWKSIVGAVVVVLASMVFMSTVSAADTWSNAIALPGFAALNSGQDIGWHEHSISCPSAGNCTAAGVYSDDKGAQGYVASEVNGVWQDALPIPGLKAMNTSNYSEIWQVSCSSVGNCSVGGATKNVAFVVDQVNGVWGQAQFIDGFPSLVNSISVVSAISCVTDGNCVAGGRVRVDGKYKAFLVERINGTWQAPIDVPGLSGMENGNSKIWALSCSSFGNCSAGGSYRHGSNIIEVFVVNQVNGVWQTAQELPGLNAANTLAFAESFEMSCWSDGNCALAGHYAAGTGQQAFIAERTSGTWQSVNLLSDIATLNTGGDGQTRAMSCSSDGTCSAGGWYKTSTGYRTFVVDRINGIWQTSTELPGLSPLDTGRDSFINGIGCSSDGLCVATGSYKDGAGYQAFAALRVGGAWQTPTALPDLGSMNTDGDAAGYRGSCANGAYCSVLGYYKTGSAQQIFVSDFQGSVAPTPPTPEANGGQAGDTATEALLPATGVNSLNTFVFALVLLIIGGLLTGTAKGKRRSVR